VKVVFEMALFDKSWLWGTDKLPLILVKIIFWQPSKLKLYGRL
jgi:hypothetical protein